jgi:CheY-like chemotaxis protein
MILAHRGYEVLVAESGPEAVELFRRDLPPLAIIDLHMPGMGGFVLLERLHSLHPKARIFIFTGADLGEAVLTRARTLGAAGVYQKGLSLQTLVDLMESPSPCPDPGGWEHHPDAVPRVSRQPHSCSFSGSRKIFVGPIPTAEYATIPRQNQRVPISKSRLPG